MKPTILAAAAVLIDFISGKAHPQGEVFPHSIIHNSPPIRTLISPSVRAAFYEKDQQLEMVQSLKQTALYLA